MYLWEAVVETGSYVLFAGEMLYLKEFSRASGLLYLIERGGAFLQE